MNTKLTEHLATQLEDLRQQGLYKQETVLSSPQQAEVQVQGRSLINLCANNYLGLSNHPALTAAAQQALGDYGFGLSSVRFICGTQTIHKQLEQKLAEFLGTDAAILYSSCFDANGGLFETLLSAEDAVLSDTLNHASIIDGVRLCKAQRLRYANNDMADLEAKLKETSSARFRLIATDAVFSMDGTIAKLADICELADRYDALVMMDDCHGVGFMGNQGRGTHEHCDVLGRIDIITGTLGKALGGASGGYTAARGEIVDWLRQRSRPYLFSNSLAPVITATSLKVLEMLAGSSALREQLRENTTYFRSALANLGFELVPGEHPIIPVMLGEAQLAQDMSAQLIESGVLVVGFSYPVVPMGKARIRTQMSAGHTRAELEQAVGAFEQVGRKLNVIR